MAALIEKTIANITQIIPITVLITALITILIMAHNTCTKTATIATQVLVVHGGDQHLLSLLPRNPSDTTPITLTPTVTRTRVMMIVVMAAVIVIVQVKCL